MLDCTPGGRFSLEVGGHSSSTMSIEEQARLSVATTKVKNYIPTPIKNNIEDVLILLDAAEQKPFGQEMSDLKTSLNFLGKVIDEMSAIQSRK